MLIKGPKNRTKAIKCKATYKKWNQQPLTITWKGIEKNKKKVHKFPTENEIAFSFLFQKPM